MQGICLRLYVGEVQKQDGKLLYEWLLEQAHQIGITGGTAFRAIAGYGRHGKLHEEAFFELAGDLPVEVEFLLNEQQAERLLRLLKTLELNLFYTKTAAEYGLTG